ncbi:MAG: hypothetical protein CVV06_00090 [Gammaproteobacteria bacterium HGW-Gammaproteobacteria-10]|nr:MAG: hypothetical protein CVV06_00090 [Gammaproteobacteria bacterium HGW-Gammaproteobacteria-10]
MVNFTKAWGAVSKDIGPPFLLFELPSSPHGFIQPPVNSKQFSCWILERHIPYLLFLDDCSIKRE